MEAIDRVSHRLGSLTITRLTSQDTQSRTGNECTDGEGIGGQGRESVMNTSKTVLRA